MQTYETTSLGAAISTFVAIHEYDSVESAIKEMVHPSKPFLPNNEAHEQYNKLYHHVYLKIYPKLKKVYKDINTFNKRY